MTKKATHYVDDVSMKFTSWMGSPLSIVAHTIFFIAIFGLLFFGFALDQIMLILTTAVSLEAIYLSLFIQMTVNRNTASLAAVERDIDEIEEDVEDIAEDIDEIQESDEREEAKESKEEMRMQSMLIKISEELTTLTTSLAHVKAEIEEMKTKKS